MTLGGIAVIAPVLLLYRANPNRVSLRGLRTAPPPPVRQAFSVKQNESLKLSDSSFQPRSVLQDHDDEVVVPTGQGVGPLHALKAFGIATCIVGAAAGTIVMGIRNVFGIQTVGFSKLPTRPEHPSNPSSQTEQFAQLMTEKLKAISPLLISRIHRDISDADLSPISSLHSTSARTVRSDDYTSKDLPETSDWLQIIEKQLEYEAAMEKEERSLRKRK